MLISPQKLISLLEHSNVRRRLSDLHFAPEDQHIDTWAYMGLLFGAALRFDMLGSLGPNLATTVVQTISLYRSTQTR